MDAVLLAADMVQSMVPFVLEHGRELGGQSSRSNLGSVASSVLQCMLDALIFLTSALGSKANISFENSSGIGTADSEKSGISADLRRAPQEHPDLLLLKKLDVRANGMFNSALESCLFVAEEASQRIGDTDSASKRSMDMLARCCASVLSRLVSLSATLSGESRNPTSDSGTELSYWVDSTLFSGGMLKQEGPLLYLPKKLQEWSREQLPLIPYEALGKDKGNPMGVGGASFVGAASGNADSSSMGDTEDADHGTDDRECDWVTLIVDWVNRSKKASACKSGSKQEQSGEAIDFKPSMEMRNAFVAELCSPRPELLMATKPKRSAKAEFPAHAMIDFVR